MKNFLKKLLGKKEPVVAVEAPTSICKCGCNKEGCKCDTNCSCVNCGCNCNENCTCKTQVIQEPKKEIKKPVKKPVKKIIKVKKINKIKKKKK